MPQQTVVSINWPFIVQIAISIMVPITMFIVTASYQTGLRQRTEILEKLDAISKHQYDLGTRLTVLENEFDRLDPHPSQRKRPV